jgi:hypothetical protein
MNTMRRIERLEAAINVAGIIPEDHKCQVIIGERSFKTGEFTPDKDSVEEREAELLKRYGTVQGVTFVELTDRFVE